MAEVTKADIAEVHKRIDTVNTSITGVRVEMAKISTHLEMLPKPPETPARPCSFFHQHMEEHKESVKMWQRPAIKAIVDIVKMAFVAVTTWFFVKK